MNIDDLYRLLRAGHIQAQGIVDTMTDPLVVLDRNLCVHNASQSFFETFNVDRFETIGKPIYELGNGQWDIPDLRKLLTEVLPRSTAIINYEVEHDFPDLGRRVMLVTARTLASSGNSSGLILMTIVDATGRYQREATKDVLFSELQHRVKNLLGITEALARTTTTDGRTAEEYRDVFLGRFRALTRAHEIAFNESEAELPRLVEQILAPYATDDTVAIRGTPLEPLDPAVLVTLSLVLHELATNAAKYGALSVSGGQVEVNLSSDPAEHKLRIHWLERGGPPVSEPTRIGHGTKLIKSSVEHTLGGTIRHFYLKEGLSVELTVPTHGGLNERPGTRD